MDTQNKLLVEVWSDVVCPFCYIGKRNYEKALAQFQFAEDLILEFKSYQLDPNFVRDDSVEQPSYKERLAAKYGRPISEIEIMIQNMTQMAQAAGLEYHLEKAKNFNTFQAHRVAQLAKEKDLGDAMEEALFEGYFIKGKDFGDTQVLTQEALKVGLIHEDIQRALTEDEYGYRVRQDIHEAANLGISGVPFFVFNRKYGVSGAQPVEVFLETMKVSHQDWTQAHPQKIQIVSQGKSCDTNGNCN